MNPGIQITKRVLTVCLLFFFFALPAYCEVVINEFMASNDQTIADGDGDYSDWIELYNSGSEPVNLYGYGLTDDLEEPFQWVFPDITIDPGQYLLVWASDKDRHPGVGELRNGILREIWWDITGASVNDLLNHPDFPDSPDSYDLVTDYFEAPADITEYFGQRMQGYIMPPVSGDYRFWIASDDNGQLFLSTNDNPDNAELIAEVPGWTDDREWDKYSAQQSDQIYLEEGQLYYISALMKEHEVYDNLAVRWQLPDGTMEEPISASRLYTYGYELHTNFAISKDGESLQLTALDGTVVDSIDPTKLPGDISCGRVTDGSGEWGFFTSATPRRSNSEAEAYSGIVDEPHFSHESGFYNDPFTLTLSSDDPEAEIYYTLDGSVPTPENNSYESGINIPQPNSGIQQASVPDSGDVVRAIAYKDDYIPSGTVTASYFVGSSVYNRFKIPVLSLVTDPENFFDPDYGIYASGNYMNRGDEWERPIHISFFEPDGNIGFTQDAGVRIHGGWTRNLPQKSLRLYARGSIYGESHFNYKIFPDHPYESYKRLILRNSGNDWFGNYGDQDKYTTMFRDALMQRLIEHLNVITQAYRPSAVYLNGQYWGIHNIRERCDDQFIERCFGVDSDEIDLLELQPNTQHLIKEGDDAHYVETYNYVQTHGLSDPEDYEYIKTRIDVNNFLDTNIAQMYVNNTDWPGNNNDFWRKQISEYKPDAPYGHDGRWRWFIFDLDFGFGLVQTYHFNMLEYATAVTTNWNNPYWATLFLRELLKNDTFKVNFINRYADQLNTAFLPGRVRGIIDEMQAGIADEIPRHAERWGTSDDNWNSFVRWLRRFADRRPEYVRDHIVDHFNLAGMSQLTLDLENPNNGYVRVNTIDIKDSTPGVNAEPYPWSGIYFQDIPVTVSAEPKQGYRFSHWEQLNGSQAESKTVTLDLTSDTTLTAVFEPTTLMHYWHFNDLPDGTVNYASADYTVLGSAAVTYLGTGDGYMDDTDGSDLNLRFGQDAGKGLRVRNPSDTRELIFTLPTTGYEDIKFSYAARRTTNGAQAQTVEYRTSAGGDWQQIGDVLTITEDYQLFSFDFTDIEAVNDNPDFRIRILFSDNASGTSGNNRFDNITLEGFGQEGVDQPPQLINPIPMQKGIENESFDIDLSEFVIDPDGTQLTFIAEIDKVSVADMIISDDILTVTPDYRGDAVITVTADDGYNPPVETEFRLLVYPQAHILSKEPFRFDYWSSEHPDHTFPDNMIFLQTDLTDPDIDDPLEYAYFVPHDDYNSDDEDTIGFPYNNTRRTRLNGLDDNGISFINTGRDRDLGGALLAIDTRGLGTAKLSWENSTVLENSREYAIRLQYRVGYSGEFQDVEDEGEPVEYMVHEDGHFDNFEVGLPEEAAGEPYVQLLWRYYHVDIEDGPRAELRLDDILVRNSTGRTDLAGFVQRWLSQNCQEPEFCNGADFNRDGKVNMEDFSLLAENWLASY